MTSIHRMTRGGQKEDELADAVTSVAQAALRGSEIWFTLRTRALQPVTDEVAEVLQQPRVPFERIMWRA